MDLDKGGTFLGRYKQAIGPSVGPIYAPIDSVLPITAPGIYPVDPAINIVTVNVAGAVTIVLPTAFDPSVPAVTLPGLFANNPITIVDSGGNAGAHPITIQPALGETIMGVASVTISVNYAGFTLLPLAATGGWVQIQPTNPPVLPQSVQWINVRNAPYNAVGNGVADDTAAINAAIAALNAAGGGELYFPSGTYLITASLTPVTVTSIIRGDGARNIYATLSGFGTDTTGTLITTPLTNGPLFTLSGGVIRFTDISLRCTAATPISGSAGILTTQVNPNSFNKYEISHFQIIGFYICIDLFVGVQSTVTYGYIANPVLYGIRATNFLVFDAGAFYLEDIEFQPLGRNCSALLKIEGGGGNRVVGCSFEGANAGGNATYGIQLQGTQPQTTIDLHIVDCNVENFTGWGIYLSPPSASYNQVLIDSIEFFNNGVDLHLDNISAVTVSNCVMGAPIEFGAGVSSISVSNNVGGPGFSLATASFTGSISGTTLTVSAIASGTITEGMTINGAGVAAGTVVSFLISGTGGIGTYGVNNSQTVGSKAMTLSTTYNVWAGNYPPPAGGGTANSQVGTLMGDGTGMQFQVNADGGAAAGASARFVSHNQFSTSTTPADSDCTLGLLADGKANALVRFEDFTNGPGQGWVIGKNNTNPGNFVINQGAQALPSGTNILIIGIAADSDATWAARRLKLAAAVAARASLNIPTSGGVAPTSPQDGDMWYDGTNVKFRVGGTTKTFTLT